MKIDVTQTFKTLSGQVLKDVDENKQAVDATLRLAIVNSLLAPSKAKEESGIEKVKKYELAKRVYVGGEVELSAEEITLIKEGIGRLFQPIIVGQAFDMLEGR